LFWEFFGSILFKKYNLFILRAKKITYDNAIICGDDVCAIFSIFYNGDDDGDDDDDDDGDDVCVIFFSIQLIYLST